MRSRRPTTSRVPSKSKSPKARSDPLRATQLLTQLRAAGVGISIDDFGTGYSSLASLQRLPIDTLKIDRSFITVTPQNADGCAIVETILSRARLLALDVGAEGVETTAQAQFLRARGCGMLQGYLFGRPELPQTCETWFAANEREATACR